MNTPNKAFSIVIHDPSVTVQHLDRRNPLAYMVAGVGLGVLLAVIAYCAARKVGAL